MKCFWASVGWSRWLWAQFGIINIIRAVATVPGDKASGKPLAPPIAYHVSFFIEERFSTLLSGALGWACGRVDGCVIHVASASGFDTPKLCLPRRRCHRFTCVSGVVRIVSRPESGHAAARSDAWQE